MPLVPQTSADTLARAIADYRQRHAGSAALYAQAAGACRPA